MNHTKFVPQNSSILSHSSRLQAQISHLSSQNDFEIFHGVTEESENENPHLNLSCENHSYTTPSVIDASITDQKSAVQQKKHLQERTSQSNIHVDALDAMTLLKRTTPNDDTTHYLSITEQPRQRKKSTNYEQKVDQFHLAEASGIKPNLFFAQDSASPTHQPNQSLLIVPQPQQQYDVDHQHSRNKQLKNTDSRYPSKKNIHDNPAPSQPDVPTTEKRKTRKLPSINDNRNSQLFSSHQSSTIILASSKTKPDPHLPSLESSSTTAESVLNHLLRPVRHKNTYSFIREQSFGKNYFHPDFKILDNDGAPLISAKKEYFHFNSYYNITVPNLGSQLVLANLRGNFGGTEFNLYQTRGDEEDLIATIIYESACGLEFRKMEIYIKTSQQYDASFNALTKRKNLQVLYRQGYTSDIQRLVSKDPVWNSMTQSYILNFGGKGKLPSTKNMILMQQREPLIPSLLFCKTSEDIFHLEVNQSLSLLVTMGILMSSFDFKLLSQ